MVSITVPQTLLVPRKRLELALHHHQMLRSYMLT